MEVQLIGSSRYHNSLTPAAHTATIMSQSFRDTMTAAIQSITKNIDACQKISELIQKLLRCS